MWRAPHPLGNGRYKPMCFGGPLSHWMVHFLLFSCLFLSFLLFPIFLAVNLLIDEYLQINIKYCAINSVNRVKSNAYRAKNMIRFRVIVIILMAHLIQVSFHSHLIHISYMIFLVSLGHFQVMVSCSIVMSRVM